MGLLGGAVDDFGDGHKRVLVLDWWEGGRRLRRVISGCCWRGVLGRADAGGADAVGGGVGGGWPGAAVGKGVFAEPELVVEYGVARVGRFHVLGGARYGDVEVEVEREDGAGEEDDEDGEGCVFEVGHGDLHAAELDTPADVGIGWGRLEAHVLPICGLDVLEVVRARGIQGFEIFVKDDDGITDEEVGEVRGESVVHTAIEEFLFELGI